MPFCAASETIMPTKPASLTQRNKNFGKPKLFVQDKGRLLAIGGSRIKSVIQYDSVSRPIRIIRPPRQVIFSEGMPFCIFPEEWEIFEYF